jgi:hypothetical protein
MAVRSSMLSFIVALLAVGAGDDRERHQPNPVLGGRDLGTDPISD